MSDCRHAGTDVPINVKHGETNGITLDDLHGEKIALEADITRAECQKDSENAADWEDSCDTREILEHDCKWMAHAWAPAEYPDDKLEKKLYREIIEKLDRQAAITANEMNHNNPYVGLVRGKQWERTEMNDYYCGRCGWKVTDHDSYCPECGGAFHKAPNKPDGSRKETTVDAIVSQRRYRERN